MPGAERGEGGAVRARAGFRTPALPLSDGLPLVHGELSPEDQREFAALKNQICRRIGFYGDGYKEKCLRRRLAVRMRACGVHRYADYAALLEADVAEYARLLDAITINVTKFFRNAEVWEALRRHVVPALFELPVPQVRLWSAGTASGEEAYSLAILLLEHAEREGCTARLRDFRVLATDIDRKALDAARRAEYRELAFSETPDAVRERWFERQGGWRPRREVRELVEFRPHDLIMEPYPARQHLILCRNVIIYFERVVQTTVFERFREALVPSGFLVLGKVESMLGGPAAAFEPVSQRDRVFRKR